MIDFEEIYIGIKLLPATLLIWVLFYYAFQQFLFNLYEIKYQNSCIISGALVSSIQVIHNLFILCSNELLMIYDKYLDKMIVTKYLF